MYSLFETCFIKPIIKKYIIIPLIFGNNYFWNDCKTNVIFIIFVTRFVV